MTKDSICKDCVSCSYVVYEKKGDRLEESSCKKTAVTADAFGDVKVFECSEFKRVQKGGKIPQGALVVHDKVMTNADIERLKFKVCESIAQTITTELNKVGKR